MQLYVPQDPAATVVEKSYPKLSEPDVEDKPGPDNEKYNPVAGLPEETLG